MTLRVFHTAPQSSDNGQASYGIFFPWLDDYRQIQQHCITADNGVCDSVPFHALDCQALSAVWIEQGFPLQRFLRITEQHDRIAIPGRKLKTVWIP